MARAPRAKVSATSGQGVSRLSYQRGYSLGKSGDAPSVGTKFSAEGGRDYAKGKAGGKYASDFNVSYGDTYLPSDLEDVKELGERKPSKGWEDKRVTAKKLK